MIIDPKFTRRGLVNYRPTVIIADTDRSFVLSIAAILNEMSFDVIPVENGSDALTYTAKYMPDIVMLNTELPALSGLEVMNKIKNDTYTFFIPVLLMSSLPDEETIEACRRLKYTKLIRKPLNLGELNISLYDYLTYPSEQKRRHLRARYNRKILVRSGDRTDEMFASTLSEGGVFVRTVDPPSTGQHLAVDIPLKKGAVALSGTVIYTKDIYGSIFSTGPGMAIQFNEMTESNTRLIRDYLSNELTNSVTSSGYVTF